MRVGIAADHGGFTLKEQLVQQLRDSGHEVEDFGAYGLDPGDDYPDFVISLSRAVAEGGVERGIAICGSGVGACHCQQNPKGTGRFDPRRVFCASRCRGRQHERLMSRGARDGLRPGLGTGPNVFGRRL